MSITGLKQYQRPRGAERFDDLPRADLRVAAEGHFRRLCAKWGDDLPQWRRAILVGRAKDLVLRPRDAAWGRRLRKGRGRPYADPAPSSDTPRPLAALRCLVAVGAEDPQRTETPGLSGAS